MFLQFLLQAFLYTMHVLGTPSLTGTTTLMIEVENSNDKAPYFTPETQRAEVTEDTPIGTVFATLKATDPDSTNLEALNFAISEPITAIDRNGQRVNDSKSFKVREIYFYSFFFENLAICTSLHFK